MLVTDIQKHRIKADKLISSKYFEINTIDNKTQSGIHMIETRVKIEEV